MLQNQLAAASDYEILDSLRDRITVLQTSIPNIINYLFEAYGELSSDELYQKEDEVYPNRPVLIIFNEILNLKDLFELTGSVFNKSTMICLGYSIVNRA